MDVSTGGLTMQPDEASSNLAFSVNISFLDRHLTDDSSAGSCTSNDTDEFTAFYNTAQFVTGLIGFPLCFVTGITGNALTMIVLSHKDMATSTNIYLMALAVSDSLKLVNDFIYSIMLIIQISSPGAANDMMVNVYPYAHYVFQVSVSVTAWLTVSVAVDRYISVCYPAHSKSLCTIPRARCVVISVNVIVILISIPSFFRYRLINVHDVKTNETCMQLVVTELGRNQEFMIPYTWLQNLLRGIIPVFILIFINARIINVLREERVKGKKLSSRNRITLMLITMIVVFILCITPDAIMSTFFGKGYVEEGNLVKGIREITDVLVAFNSAVNFILYCSLSAIFRRTFMRVFCGRYYDKMRVGGATSVGSRNKSPKSLNNHNDVDPDDACCEQGLALAEFQPTNGRKKLINAVHNNIRDHEEFEECGGKEGVQILSPRAHSFSETEHSNGYKQSHDLDQILILPLSGPSDTKTSISDRSSQSPYKPHYSVTTTRRHSVPDAVHVKDASNNKVVLFVYQDVECEGVPL